MWAHLCTKKTHEHLSAIQNTSTDKQAADQCAHTVAHTKENDTWIAHELYADGEALLFTDRQATITRANQCIRHIFKLKQVQDLQSTNAHTVCVCALDEHLRV